MAHCFDAIYKKTQPTAAAQNPEADKHLLENITTLS